jgi:transposase
MPKSRPPYPAEFRQQIVDLAQAGKTIAELSREFGCSTQTIRNWIGEAAADARKTPPSPKDPLSSAEREEMARLRRRVRQLEMERDILAKATAWFAGNSDATSKTSTKS